MPGLWTQSDVTPHFMEKYEIPPEGGGESFTKVFMKLQSYCQRCWQNFRIPADLRNDCTQDLFCRLLERVDKDRFFLILRSNTPEKKEFVRAINTVAKRYYRRKMHLPLQGDHPARESGHLRHEQVQENIYRMLSLARAHVSRRQFRVLFQAARGLEVAQIASLLDMPAPKVSNMLYKAIQKLKASIGLCLCDV